jgi:MtN3 and saliva related transmembrane protein
MGEGLQWSNVLPKNRTAVQNLLMNPEVLGIIAGVLTTTAFVPQVWRAWSTRSVDDISLEMFVLFTVGVTLWTVYGLMTRSLAVTLANLVTFALAVSVVVAKLRFGKKR